MGENGADGATNSVLKRLLDSMKRSDPHLDEKSEVEKIVEEGERFSIKQDNLREIPEEVGYTPPEGARLAKIVRNRDEDINQPNEVGPKTDLKAAIERIDEDRTISDDDLPTHLRGGAPRDFENDDQGPPKNKPDWLKDE